MGPLIKKYFVDRWWFPILIFGILMVLFGISLLVDSSLFDELFSVFLFMLAVSVLVLALLISLFHKKWLVSILHLGLIFASVFSLVVLFVMSELITMDEVEPFTKDVELPKNVELAEPIDLELRDQTDLLAADSEKEKIAFQLYNSYQPGLYEYDLWLDSKEKGKVYLKAYEITKEIRLSRSRLKGSSEVEIEHTGGKVKKFSTKHDFTIYEGDWGHPYGARFEIWFEPDSGPERKLFEKNYRIEGWMR